MSRATLAVVLSKLKLFKNPKTRLEQYPTPSEAAATILWDAHTRNLIEDKVVLDLGAGTGILGIGALILGAKKVFFVEIDADASSFIKENVQIVTDQLDITLGEYEIIEKDIIAEYGSESNSASSLPIADLAVLNPPFGTKEKHVDSEFLDIAIRNSPQVYSFHKTITKKYLINRIQKQGAHLVQEFPFLFDLPATMKQHQKKSYKVAISCFHVERTV